MAPLQKRALYSLVFGLVLTAALVAALLAQGDITAFDTDPNMRVTVYAAMIGVPLVYLVLVNLTLRKPAQVDERDKRIVAGSGHAQWMAAIVSLVFWTIVLTEVYHEQGQVPIAFLNLIVASTLVVGTLAQAAGILLGYGSSGRNG